MSIPFSNKLYRGYMDEANEAENIFELLKDCNAGTLKEELTHRGIQFTVLKDKEKRLYLSMEHKGKYYHIKVHNFVKEFRLNKAVGNLFSPSQARRSWEMARRFLDLGLTTPKPLGYLESRRLGVLLSSIFVTEYLPDAMTLRDRYTLLSNSIEKRSFIIELARFTAILHNKGVIHGDLKASNILVRRDNLGRIYFYVTDLASIKFKNHPTMDEMAADIACLDTSFGSELSPRERLRFLCHYCRGMKGLHMDMRRLIVSVQNYSKERLKKRQHRNAERNLATY